MLVKGNDGHDEAKPVLSVRVFPNEGERTRNNIVTSRIVCMYSTIKEKNPIWDAKSAVTPRGLAAAFSIKKESDLRTPSSLSHFRLQLPVSSSHISLTSSPRSQQVKDISLKLLEERKKRK